MIANIDELVEWYSRLYENWKGFTPWNEKGIDRTVLITKVKAPFLIHVDSYMILYENCREDLRKSMTDSVGVAIGQLKDPLMGTGSGGKLFRKEC